MKRNQFWTVASKGLAVMTVTLIGISPGTQRLGSEQGQDSV